MQVIFPSRKVFVESILPSSIKKTMTMYVYPTLVNCVSTIFTFDLWMLKGAHDIFVVVVNFISSNQEAKLVTIGLFKVSGIGGITMAPKLQLVTVG